MRIAYLDCPAGIAGDMTLAALIDAGASADTIRRGIQSLGLKGVRLQIDKVMRGGFRAVHVRVEHPEQHAHRHLSDITQLITDADGLTDTQKTIALNIFAAIAEAEATVHGTTPDRIHFHEVGAIDSIVDVVGVAIGFDLLKIDEIICSPVPTGCGTVRIAHGECAVPTPGTAELLKGVPLAQVEIAAELTTPTGAAIVKSLVDRFSAAVPAMTIESIGHGAGTRDLKERANILRLLVGTSGSPAGSDQVWLLETSLDDVSGEIIGYAKQMLLERGALDVYTTAIQMKKNRPGVLLSVLCPQEKLEEIETILFQETGTFGLRKQLVQRSIRFRDEMGLDSDWGEIKGKVGWREGEPALFKPEFESCARIAREQRIPLRDVYRAVELWFRQAQEDGQFDDDEHGHDHDHSHDHGHHHDHDHSHDCGHDHDHSHDHSHDHDHGHDCGHDHDR